MNSLILLALVFCAKTVFSGCMPTNVCTNTYQAIRWQSGGVPYQSAQYVCDGVTKSKVEYDSKDCMANATSTVIESTDAMYDLIDCTGECTEYVRYRMYDILVNNTNCDGYESAYYEESLYPVRTCMNGWLLGTKITCTDSYVTTKLYWGDVTCDSPPSAYRATNGCNFVEGDDNIIPQRSYFTVQFCGVESKSNYFLTLMSFALLSAVTFIM